MGGYGEFSEILKRLRLAKGLTQGEMADRLKISRSRISMYETGQRQPDYETLELIADFFNVDIDYLLGRSRTVSRIPEAEYYVNPETAILAQEMFENKELRALYDVQRDMPPEDLKAMYGIALALKRKERGTD